MTRKQVDILMARFENAEKVLDRIEAQTNTTGSYYARVMNAQDRMKDALQDVERAEDELGEARCVYCNNWRVLTARCDCATRPARKAKAGR